jgi:hypothetical protein
LKIDITGHSTSNANYLERVIKDLAMRLLILLNIKKSMFYFIVYYALFA